MRSAASSWSTTDAAWGRGKQVSGQSASRAADTTRPPAASPPRSPAVSPPGVAAFLVAATAWTRRITARAVHRLHGFAGRLGRRSPALHLVRCDDVSESARLDRKTPTLSKRARARAAARDPPLNEISSPGALTILKGEGYRAVRLTRCRPRWQCRGRYAAAGLVAGRVTACP